MNRIQILLIYVLSILFVLMKMRQPFIYIDSTIIGQLYSFFSILLIATQFHTLKRCKYHLLILGYSITLFVSLYFVQEKTLSTIFSWLTPVYIAALLQNYTRHNYSILSYLYIIVFMANACIAIYERLTLSLIMEPDMDEEILQAQMVSDEMDSSRFRAFALFGHPLTNANIMAFMSFIIYYSTLVNKKNRIIFTILGLLSLLCFNARGAILVSIILLSILMFLEIRTIKQKIMLSIIAIAFLGFFYFADISIDLELWGGRLYTNEIMDDSAAARITTINEFFSIPFKDLIIGGNHLSIGENGYLMILAEYGLIIGGFKIFVEIFLSYKLLYKGLGRIPRIIIVSSLILIGSTNNNLCFPIVFPMYMLCITFVCNNRKNFQIATTTNIKMKQTIK